LSSGQALGPRPTGRGRSACLRTCEALATTHERFACTAFDRTFRELGLLAAILTGNGVPFAFPTALYRVSKLAVCTGRFSTLARPSSVLRQASC